MVKKVMKNTLLISLVLLAVVLASQIWFNSYFLPGGYDFFFSGIQHYIVNPIQSLFSQNSDGSFSQNLKKLYRPEKIILNDSGERRVLTEGQEDYDTAYDLANAIVSRVLSGDYDTQSKTLVNMDAYMAALKGKSIHVDYGKACDYRLFSFGVCGESQSHLSGELSAVGGYVISLQDSIMDDISVYMIDQKSGNIYRYTVESEKVNVGNQITELVQKISSEGLHSYSFELNFHKEQENAASKILFEPMLLMELMPLEANELQSQQLAEFGHGISEDLINDVLRTFSVNTRSMWRYTEMTGARVFVENDATLTLHPDGLIEYQAVEGGRGLDISDADTPYDIYAATDNAVEFVTKLCSDMPPEFLENLRIRTDLLDHTDRQGVYTICFDYCVDGIPVRHKTADGYAHTIELEIDNGYLKSYRQFVRSYIKTEQKTSVVPMLSAADILVDSLYNEAEPLQVQRIHLCYVENETGKLTPVWNAVVDATEHFVQ
ncbi:MAG: hypothetical protein E7400_07290 [Ruminococcaceae bacterium]|nr:hypothetical protein [Oscillospiraceae bacterium]